MAESQPVFPDILGSITGGARFNVNAAQVALAVRPRNVRAGRPFEVILLIQNAADSDLDVTAILQLPQDAKKKPNRFIAKAERLVVGLRPAEVGYVVLPVTSLPDTAISDIYKVGVSVDVKVAGKPKRIRANDGGGAVELDMLNPETVEKMNDLKKLTFSTSKRGLMGTVLEVPFNVLSAQIGQLVDLKAQWVSLWKISDLRDERVLLARYGDALQTTLLPRLKRELVYAPLYQTTEDRFRQAGYTLQAAEAHYITKLLVYILEMAAPEENTTDYLSDERYNVALALKRFQRGETAQPVLPGWCKAMLKAIDTNPSAAEQPASVLAGHVYDELLRDAMRLGFQMVGTATGENMGSEEDIHDYIEKWITKLNAGQAVLRFSDVYLPLLLGGVIIYDRAVLKTEKVGEMLTELSRYIKSSYAEVSAEDEMVYSITEQIIDRAFLKFGYRA
ncbi:MAG: hypothetical protein LCI00_10815 [Chloroflexi bacterium]|nr:hypothetical protein [Chloroflexota bacterium]MCC6892069.1 hypothetical protein [Anaerolineae bacterium]